MTTPKKKTYSVAHSTMTPEEFAAIRKLLGIDQAELGKRLGIGRMEISHKETGNRPITAPQAAAMYGMLLARCVKKLNFIE